MLFHLVVFMWVNTWRGKRKRRQLAIEDKCQLANRQATVKILYHLEYFDDTHLSAGRVDADQRIELRFRCILLQRQTDELSDLAGVRAFGPRKWKPTTRWFSFSTVISLA